MSDFLTEDAKIIGPAEARNSNQNNKSTTYRFRHKHCTIGQGTRHFKDESMKKFLSVVAFFHMALATSAHAVVIEYELTDLGGDRYRYDYTVVNDGAVASEIGLFDINFNTDLYEESSLTPDLSAGVAADWDGLVLGSGIGLPAVFDMFAFGSGLAIGETLTNFGIEFRWIGAGDPGTQSFDVFDPFTFEFLGSGETIASSRTVDVPEPSTLLLLLSGLLAMCARLGRVVNVHESTSGESQ